MNKFWRCERKNMRKNAAEIHTRYQQSQAAPLGLAVELLSTRSYHAATFPEVFSYEQ
jgi:hypothetical protein